MNCSAIKDEYYNVIDSVCVDLVAKTSNLYGILLRLEICGFAMFFVSVVVVGISRPKPFNKDEKKQSKNDKTRFVKTDEMKNIEMKNSKALKKQFIKKEEKQ